MEEFKKGDRVFVSDNSKRWYKGEFIKYHGKIHSARVDNSCIDDWLFCKLDPDYQQTDTPKHYDNSKGSLYKIAIERGWNAYQFDIVKRIDRAEKKGEFENDLNKTIKVIELWKNENQQKK